VNSEKRKVKNLKRTSFNPFLIAYAKALPALAWALLRRAGSATACGREVLV